jgi:hypothetical protein
MTEQRIVVVQQQGSGDPKIRGIREHGRGMRIVKVVSIDEPLPEVLDEPEAYLPSDLEADLVLDFTRHPDLTWAVAELCRRRGIPVVASGKKIRVEGIFTPPT